MSLASSIPSFFVSIILNSQNLFVSLSDSSNQTRNWGQMNYTMYNACYCVCLKQYCQIFFLLISWSISAPFLCFDIGNKRKTWTQNNGKELSFHHPSVRKLQINPFHALRTSDDPLSKVPSKEEHHMVACLKCDFPCRWCSNKDKDCFYKTLKVLGTLQKKKTWRGRG